VLITGFDIKNRMANPKDKMMDDRLKEILRYDLWECRLCEGEVDAMSKFNSDEQKTNLLGNHIRTKHNKSRDIDPLLDEKYYPLYFKPKIQVTQDNEILE
jgi:hypothetical protein